MTNELTLKLPPQQALKPVESKQDIEIYKAEISDLKTKRSEVVKYWSEPKAKAFEAHRSISSKESAMLKIIDDHINARMREINKYLAKIESERKAEQSRLEQERLEKEKLEKSLSPEIETVFVPPVLVEKEDLGIKTKIDLEIEIVDIEKFLSSFLSEGYNPEILDIKVNATKLKSFIKSFKIKSFDGLRITEQTKGVVR